MVQGVGVIFVPALLTVMAMIILFSQKDLASEFIQGAKNGLITCVDLIPIFILLMTAVGMFSGSGVMDALCDYVSDITKYMGIPGEILPVVLIRPLSGSAASATVSDLFASSGPDSFAGRCASVIMGASDTIVYTLTLYFGAAGIRKTRYAYPAAFLTLAFCTFFSLLLVTLFF